MRRIPLLAAAAAVTGAALVLAGCAGPSGGSADGSTLTLWSNSTTGPGAAYWKAAAAAFEKANKGVTVKVQTVQNEDYDQKLQTAMNSGSAPDLFMQRGGGKMADQVTAGQVMDITDKITPATKKLIPQGSFSAETYEGKVYAMPLSLLPSGIWYSKNLFAQAGIDSPPTTMAEFSAAVTKLKAAGITPIALGAKDAWPAGHWYYNFALRECSQSALAKAAKSKSFDDPCWLRAGEDLQKLKDSEPFNTGFLTTPAQQGASSSAGLVANRKAAMEDMGAWNPGVIASLTPDKKPLPDLGWFTFPTVSGGKGDPSAIMSGLDGFSCRAGAPKSCVDFLNFIATTDQQKAYYTAFNALPVNTEAQSVVTEPYLKDVLSSYNKAAYVSLWLDSLYGQNVGTALNVAVVNLLAGKGDAAALVSSVNAAAKKG